jgi:hypothetical protein
MVMRKLENISEVKPGSGAETEPGTKAEKVTRAALCSFHLPPFFLDVK